MITFYPGPSKLYPEIESYLGDAFRSGLLSMNHRSEPFMKLLSEAIRLLKEKLGIHETYEVVLTSSATECWEIIAQSLTVGKSFHLYNGAFGKKWQEYAHRIHGRSEGMSYGLNEQPHVRWAACGSEDLLCVTHTETSNGTAIEDLVMKKLRADFPGLVAVDATASMGGVPLPWEAADIWFASVQKCFGLPSGLAVMVLSPSAVKQAVALGENDHYNSLAFVIDNFRKFQTPYTPNILGIYLLKRQMDSFIGTDKAGKELEKRSRGLYTFLEENGFSLLVENPACRAITVMAVKDEGNVIREVKEFAAEDGIVLGNGYGEWKSATFRLANFPAISSQDFDSLKRCLTAFRSGLS